MPAAQREADVVWEGDLLNGSGRVKMRSSAVPEFPVTWASRTDQQANGKTSPEELLAAAHASCFSMALSAALARNRTPGQRLQVSAVSTFDKVGDGWKVMKMELSVMGKVQGIDQNRFEELARTAGANCPISNALKNNVEIVVHAKLE